jgi:hypothetical protein
VVDDQVQEWTWQYCRDGYDITSQPLYAEQDADEVRVWDGEFCLLAVVRDDGCWRIDTSDVGLPDDADDQTFRTPAAALDWLTAAREAVEQRRRQHRSDVIDDA